MNLCPFATQDREEAESGGDFVGGPPRGVLHTTDGFTYKDARDAYVDNNSWPHFTVTFEDNVFEVFQHLPIDVAARSLEHRGGTVQTNLQSAIQIEIVGFAEDSPGFSKDYLDGIAKLMRWIEINAGVARTIGVDFKPVDEETRLDDGEWLAYGGWCGHQHVPNNEHADPGAIDILYLLSSGFSGSPSTSPAPKLFVGDGTWSFVAEAIGDDIVVRGVTATWFGGDDDPEDDGHTASGIDTKGNPGLLGCALPLRDRILSTAGSPIPDLPWKTMVEVSCTATGKTIEVPLIDLGPAKSTGHAIDLTQAAFTKLGVPLSDGVMTVDYRIIRGISSAK